MAITGETFFGQADEASTAVDMSIHHGNARCWSIEATAAAKKVKLQKPADVDMRAGFPSFFVYNKGATHAFSLATEDGTVIVSVPIGNVAAVGLIDADGAAGQGTWITKVTVA